ncbi:unnamed protein product, partial [marine sediment metagenome]
TVVSVVSMVAVGTISMAVPLSSGLRLPQLLTGELDYAGILPK